MASGSLPIEQRLHGGDAGTRHGAGRAGLAIASQAAIGIDADEAVARDVLDRHGAHVGDFDAFDQGGGQGVEAVEETGGGKATARRRSWRRVIYAVSILRRQPEI